MNISMDEQDIERIASAVAVRLEAPQAEWLDAKEAAEYLRCSPRYLNRLAYLGELPTYRPAGKRLFRRSELDAYVHQTKED